MNRLIAALVMLLSIASFADEGEVKLVIESHRFTPERLEVPAGRKVRLLVENRDATPEEFESHALNREKVIPGKSSAILFIGPLKPGDYPFVGEFHESSARGVIVAR